MTRFNLSMVLIKKYSLGAYVTYINPFFLQGFKLYPPIKANSKLKIFIG